MNKTLLLAIGLSFAATTVVAEAHNTGKHHKHHTRHHVAQKAEYMQPMMAETSTWYLGIGPNYYAGFTEETSLTSVLPAPVGKHNAKFKLNDQSVGGRIIAGKQVSKYLGFEVSFDWLGDRTYNPFLDGIKLTNIAELKVKDSWNIAINGLAFLPIFNHFDLYAKGGVGYFTSETEINILPGSTTPQKIENDLSTMGAIWGAGIQFKYEQFGARLGYNQVLFNKKQELNTFNVPSYLTLDLMYFFS